MPSDLAPDDTRSTTASGPGQQPAASQPLVRFHNLFPGAPPPERADRAAKGILPTRAFRHCEALCTASSLGWYLYPPMDFKLVWDGGTDVQWTYDGAEGWYQLTAAQFPNFADQFNASAPDEAKGFSPAFLANFPEPGIVQIWTGIVARTAPGWNLLVRPPANMPRSHGYDLYEGIVETDRWFGPLFSNVRLTQIGVPVIFQAKWPLLQVQPVHRSTLANTLLENFEIADGVEDLAPEDWADFRSTVVRPNVDPERRRGAYAVRVRQRRKREGDDAPPAPEG
ncbi:DUF6065 family protein [Muricoccus radiodurans]|uniref:DUF6065 family protein n=1 Tax=Muricoccus radiodurans TaxID=2231721 RepID=UPI003CF3F486